MDRDELHKKLQEYDVAFIPLVKRIYGSVPSKIFEYTRLGLPVLYFAGGEGGTIVENEELGWTVPVNNFEALQNYLNSISTEELKRFPKEVVQKNSISAFDFKKQFDEFIISIEVL